MLLAIHHRPNSFSDRWLSFCQEHRIPYRIVDCYRSDVLGQIEECSGLLWHWHQDEVKAILCARQIIRSVEAAGVMVFPSSSTCWHFDDKIAQKYLFDALKVPCVPTYVFFDLASSLQWVDSAHFPKVFKLRNGAGSSNVSLVTSRRQAAKLCHQAFGRGFRAQASYFSDARTKARRVAGGASGLLAKARRAPHSLWRIYQNNLLRARERGYVYFQDFLPGNQYDTRIVVIGERAFGFTRGVRPNDFRASGSGVSYNLDSANIDLECVRIAHSVTARIGAQSLALDFIRDEAGAPRLVEISYCFASGTAGTVHQCPGYWDRHLEWHTGSMWPEDAILSDFVAQVEIDARTRGAGSTARGDAK